MRRGQNARKDFTLHFFQRRSGMGGNLLSRCYNPSGLCQEGAKRLTILPNTRTVLASEAKQSRFDPTYTSKYLGSNTGLMEGQDNCHDHFSVYLS